MGAKCLPRIETTDLIKVLGDVAEEHEIYLSEIHPTLTLFRLSST